MPSKNAGPYSYENPNQMKIESCPTCKANLILRLDKESAIIICNSCFSVVQTDNGPLKRAGQTPSTKSRKQVLEIGQLGKLHGTVWQVVGYLERIDNTGTYDWSEYLLYNSAKGFRWLTEGEGHWNYVLTAKERPVTDHISTLRSATYLGKRYALFHEGTGKVTHVSGEFYWKVEIDDLVSIRDYVSPPEILTFENDKGEVIWSIGEYLSHDDLKKAFQIIDLPSSSGIAPNQVSMAASISTGIFNMWAGFAIFLVLVQFSFLSILGNKPVYSANFEYKSDDRVRVSNPFKLENGVDNVRIKLYAPVEQSWLEIQGDLINDDTGAAIPFEQGVERYSGRDDEGSWSDGSQDSALILSSVPAGNYHLNMEGTTGNLASLTYSIEVTRSVPTWSNFMWALILISIFPLLVWWRSRSFETDRWLNSDYSPFPQHRDE